MTSDLPDLRGDFLDDFYSECDELLGSIRAQLTTLDDACRAARADPVALEALYRHVHSLKGISTMVGLCEAEQLAHAAEGLLRLRQGARRQPQALSSPSEQISLDCHAFGNARSAAASVSHVMTFTPRR
ncbi:MAG: Hpt domain-containing protein [Opitutaceae bacterium]